MSSWLEIWIYLWNMLHIYFCFETCIILQTNRNRTRMKLKRWGYTLWYLSIFAVCKACGVIWKVQNSKSWQFFKHAGFLLGLFYSSHNYFTATFEEGLSEGVCCYAHLNNSSQLAPLFYPAFEHGRSQLMAFRRDRTTFILSVLTPWEKFSYLVWIHLIVQELNSYT